MCSEANLQIAYLLVLAHKALECLVSEASLVGQAKFGVEILHFWSRLQQLHEVPKVVEIQEPTVLRVGLLCRSSAIIAKRREEEHVP